LFWYVKGWQNVVGQTKNGSEVKTKVLNLMSSLGLCPCVATGSKKKVHTNTQRMFDT